MSFTTNFQISKPAKAAGTTYYVDATGGLDTNSGLDTSHAWKTIAKVNGLTCGSAPGQLNAGDTVEFKSGETWRERLTVPCSGTAGNPITFGAYGSGANPIVSGANLAPSGSWTSEVEGGTNFTGDANLQAYWLFENNLNDGTANANTLTSNGSPAITYATTPAPIQGTYSASFVAANSNYGSRADADLSAGFVGKNGTTNTNITIGGWFYFNSVSGGMAYFAKSTTPSYGGSLSATYKPVFTMNLDGGVRTATADNAISALGWYHIIGRLNSVSKKMELFVNGQKQAISYTATSTTINVNTGTIRIGAWSGSPYFNGYGDEFIVFNRALTDAEIQGIYTYGLNGARSNFTSYYQTGFTQPEAIYENNTAMTAAATKATMTAGSWWWDSINSRVYIRATGDVNPSTEAIDISQRANCIYNTKSYITIYNLTCQEAYDTAIRTTGAYVILDHITIQHMHSTVTHDGVAIASNGPRTTIQYSTVTDANWGIVIGDIVGTVNDSTIVQYNHVSYLFADGIGLGPLHSDITNALVQYNEVDHCGAWGTATECLGLVWNAGAPGTAYGSGVVFRYNHSHHNGTVTNPGHGAGSQDTGGVGGNGVVWYNNLIHDNYNVGILVMGINGESWFNNTVYNNGLEEIGLTQNSANITIENNIFFAAAGQLILSSQLGATTGHVIDYNGYYGGSLTPFRWGGTTYNFADYKTVATQDSHSLNSDPKFISVSISDFHLQSSSPAIDTGTNVGLTSDYDGVSVPRGNGYEIGAYEYPVPIAPTIGVPSAQSFFSIRWNFTDNSNDETGFRVYDNTNAIVASSATPNLSYLDETGLSPNTQYTGRYVKAYNSYGSSVASAPASSICTLAQTSQLTSQPSLSISYPNYTNWWTYGYYLPIRGTTIDEESGISRVWIYNMQTEQTDEVSVNSDGYFEQYIWLERNAKNVVQVNAQDNAGNLTTKELNIHQIPLSLAQYVPGTLAAEKEAGRLLLEKLGVKAVVFNSIFDNALDKDVKITDKGEIIIYTQSPKFQGTTIANGNVDLYINSSQEIRATTTADIAGNWQYQLTQALDYGEHTISATVTDKDGNISQPTDKLVFTIKNPSEMPLAAKVSRNVREFQIWWVFAGLALILLIILGYFLLRTKKKYN